MKTFAGVTKNPTQRRAELSARFNGLRNWQTTYTFKDRAAAEKWLDTFAGRYDCVKLPTTDGPETEGTGWRGISFEAEDNQG